MKYIFLNSGGIDSLALAVKLSNNRDEMHSLHFNQGAPSSDAQEVSAKAIADKYCFNHTTINLHGLLLPPLVDGRIRSMSYQTPAFAMLGASFAVQQDIPSVVSGNRNERYPREFERNFTRIMELSPRIRLYSRPLGGMNLSQVLEIIGDNELLNSTVSCLSFPPCGTCHKCKARLDNGISL